MWILILFFLVWQCVVSNGIDVNPRNKLRYCVAKGPTQNHQVKLSKLNNNNDSIEYIIVNDRSSCARQLITDKADFAVFEPEDLVTHYSTTDLEYSILITHELRFWKLEKTRYEMVALVSRDIHSFADLENKRFCHPGYDSGIDDWTRTFANYFQSWIMPRSCDSDKTMFENEISSLSNYFESACIAGPWTFDTKEDSRLKIKYRNLCALCDNPNGCYSGDKYYGREGALLCFTDGVGDVAWVRLQDTIAHFEAEKIDKNLYNYLCPDGSSVSMSNGNPCVWITKPWPVIAARRKIAEKVEKKIKSLSTGKTSWRNDFLLQLESYLVVPVNTDTLQIPADYLNQYNGFAGAYSRTACSRSRNVKWCVASNLEQEKCLWIRNVAFSHGIEPTISCHLHPGRNDCIEAVHTGICDFFVTRPEETLQAYEKNISFLLQLVSKKTSDLNIYGILVKNDSKYFNLEDLKGTRACFSKQHSIEWDAFVAVMANRTNNPTWYCSNNELINFFQSIILNNSINTNNDDDDNNDNGHMSRESILIDNTYECLTSGKGDVAFVNINLKNDSYRSRYNLRNICIDPKSNECFLAWTTLGMIIVNSNMTQLRRDEIHEMLMEFNAWFGSKYVHQPLAFSLYGPFDSYENVIFPEKAQSLQEDISYVRFSRNYLDILKTLKYQKMQSTCTGVNLNAIPKMIFYLSLLLTFINFP